LRKQVQAGGRIVRLMTAMGVPRRQTLELPAKKAFLIEMWNLLRDAGSIVDPSKA